MSTAAWPVNLKTSFSATAFYNYWGSRAAVRATMPIRVAAKVRIMVFPRLESRSGTWM
jgi:hypothetical protein